MDTAEYIVNDTTMDLVKNTAKYAVRETVGITRRKVDIIEQNILLYYAGLTPEQRRILPSVVCDIGEFRDQCNLYGINYTNPGRRLDAAAIFEIQNSQRNSYRL